MLRPFELWAKNRKVVEIRFGINSGDAQGTVARFAGKMGFEEVGKNFVKGLV